MENKKINWSIGKVFFYLLLLVCLANLFYLPYCFTDRFFTSGMLWTVMTVPVFFCLYLFVAGREIKFSGIGLYIITLIVSGGCYGWLTDNFSTQQMTYTGTLCLLMLMLGNSQNNLNLHGVFFLLTTVALIEALLGIIQYFGWNESYNSRFPVTGTFENPAGLGIYLAVSFPFAFFFVWQESLKWRWWGIIASGLLLVAILLSGSRTGLIAAIVPGCLAAYGCLSIHRVWKRRLLLTICGLLFVLFIALYFMKKDSADGRLLIWQSTCEMVREAPLLGHGPGSFGGKYMLYQADFLAKYPTGWQSRLADNVKHPFNEYLKVGVEYGITGLLLVFIGMIWIFRIRRWAVADGYPLFLSITALAVCALFSYPLNYPSIHILLFIILGLMVRNSRAGVLAVRGQKIIAGTITLGLLCFAVYWVNMEVRWTRAAYRALAADEKVLADYREMLPFMCQNPLFLYNYGAELHERSFWVESNLLLEECAKLLNDTDVQLLLADNYTNTGDHGRAEHHLLIASRMCPNRFLPLYNLVKLYDSIGRCDEACRLAQQILNKPIKVPSYTIDKIKKEMEVYVKYKSEK